MHDPLQYGTVALPSYGKVFYAAAGEGPPVVLLHGLGACQAVWRPTALALAGSHSVYAPDLLGHGDSDKPRRRYELDGGVEFTVAFMDALGIADAVLAGNSMGGLVALATALRHPDRVRALALVGAAGLGRELARPLRLASVPLIGPLLALLDSLIARDLLEAMFYDPHVVDPQVLQELRQHAKERALRRAVLSMIRDGITPRGLRPKYVLLERLAELRCPLLVVWGKNDGIIPARHAQEVMARRPDAQVHLLDRCGHLPQLEQPDLVSRLLADFIAGVPAAKGEGAR